MPSCWWCWEDGDRDQPPGYLTALGVAPCVPMAYCVHGAAFWATNPVPGHFCLYTAGGWGGVVNFSRVTGLRCWQHRRARAGGWPDWGCFTAVIVKAQNGTGSTDSVPAWAAHPATAVALPSTEV